MLDAIGKIGRANGAALSSRFGILMSAVLKLAMRLTAGGLIVTDSIPGNRKESWR